MLGDHPITPVLLAKDLVAAREFYHDTLGLEIATEDENPIVLTCGGGTTDEHRLDRAHQPGSHRVTRASPDGY